MSFGKKMTKGVTAGIMTGMVLLAVGLVVSVPILMLGNAAGTPIVVGGNETLSLSIPPTFYYFAMALPFVMFAIGFAAPISIVTAEADDDKAPKIEYLLKKANEK